MLSRNRELRRFAATYLLLTALLAAAALIITGPQTALWVLGASVVLGAVVAWFTRKRYQAIAGLSNRLDECLHGERNVQFASACEGELAVLSNEIEKLLHRLTLTAEQLDADRELLADSLADISHQLKTPLTSLALMTELVRKRIMERGADVTEHDLVAIADRLRAIEAIEDRITWLVSALLKIARLDAGTIKLACELVDPLGVVQEAVAPLAVSFDLADVELSVDVQPDCSYRGDAAWSAEALRNVVKNCLEHTPARGTVRIRVTEDALACRIVVTDTGPGISDKDLPHVFERFYRGSTDGRGDAVNPAGVGIGLALAQSLVTAQNGTIRAGNVHDANGATVGARFEIAFFKSAV